MYNIEDLKTLDVMPNWADISLNLYKQYSIEILFPKIFRYYLENGQVINIQFQEWAMKHLWAIHHINGRINKNALFQQIDDGLEFSSFMTTQQMRKRLMDNKDRIRMFACIYTVLKTGNLFYVEEGQLPETEIKVDYIRSKIISAKGVNLGMRLEDEIYVPITLLIDRAVNPTKTIQKLAQIYVTKLEIIENNSIVETIIYDK